MGYTKKAKMKIYRTDHVIDFHEERVTAEQIMGYLQNVPKNALLKTVWFDDENETHINMEFVEIKELEDDEDN